VKVLVEARFGSFRPSPTPQKKATSIDWWPELHLQQGQDAHSALRHFHPRSSAGALTSSALAPETSVSEFPPVRTRRLEADAKTDFDLPVASRFFLR
jgi:hypothetical protein